MDIILVIGKVTAQQYKPVQHLMLRRGLKPRIVRIDTTFSTYNDFAMAAFQDGLQYDVHPITFLNWNAFYARRCSDRMEEVVRDAFGDLSSFDTKFILWEPLGPNEHPSRKMQWLFEFLPEMYEEYWVHVSDDGTFELQKTAYATH